MLIYYLLISLGHLLNLNYTYIESMDFYFYLLLCQDSDLCVVNLQNILFNEEAVSVVSNDVIFR